MDENTTITKFTEAALSTGWLGKPALFFPEIGSTNDRLREMARSGQPAGTMIIADYQTQGKGRLDRPWIAPQGTSLLFSLLLTPDWPVEHANWLVMMAGLSIVEAIEQEADLEVGLKWPNDVVVFHLDRWRKVAGILLETAVINKNFMEAVVGIGINVNQVEEDFRDDSLAATSLRIASGRPLSRFTLLDSCLLRFEKYYDKAENGESPQLKWDQRLVNIGKDVAVSLVGSPDKISGKAVGTNARGWLLLKDEKGMMHEFPAGDVTFLG